MSDLASAANQTFMGSGILQKVNVSSQTQLVLSENLFPMM